MTDLETRLTPRIIVSELDKYIIGQGAAKRAVAIAVRNRWRRLRLAQEMRDDVTPKNILMIGPTGVGKTEISRRLAQLVKAPFIKVEASRYTEVGYHGRDVESMVRDLVEIAHNMVKAEEMERVHAKAEVFAEDRLVELLLPMPAKSRATPEDEASAQSRKTTADKMREKLRAGDLDERFVEISVEEKSNQMMSMLSVLGMEDMPQDFQAAMGGLVPAKNVVKKVSIPEARRMLVQQEGEKLVDREKVVKEALARAANSGIIFIDEIDKVASKQSSHGPDVSREGVQRDLLPIVEGTSVTTRHGPVRTDHMLFIAAGAFHMSKPSDLIPELQGRFPIRVELTSLGKEEFVRILTEPKNALIKQYQALLETEKIKLSFDEGAIDEFAGIAAKANTSMQNIGARRLYTVVEKVLEDVSFDAPDMKNKKFPVTREYVREKLKDIVKDDDLSKYIL